MLFSCKTEELLVLAEEALTNDVNADADILCAPAFDLSIGAFIDLLGSDIFILNNVLNLSLYLNFRSKTNSLF